MAGVAGAPSPPGAYDVVVVGSGPGGLQASYCLGRLGVRHAVISRDAEPGGMFRTWPIFGRLLSWSHLDAPFARDTVEYERYDHNSLVADEPALRGLVPAGMGGESVIPTRAEMAAGMAAFAERAALPVRYGCTWTGTRFEDGGAIVLETDAGEYRCRAAVLAVGVTDPWTSPIAGSEHAIHYADVTGAERFRDGCVLVVGKRNSGFELADGLLPYARRIVLASPQPVRPDVLGQASVRARYLQPVEIHAAGGGTFALDIAVERIRRLGGRFWVTGHGTTRAGEPVAIDADHVIMATGFRAPLADLVDGHGLMTVARGRVPALTPFWESVSHRGIFFAGNATQGAPGPRKHGFDSSSAAVHGFRYNARLLARHLAERLLGRPPACVPVAAGDVADVLAGALERAPELWSQKGYLARVVLLDGPTDAGVQPLDHFLEGGEDAVAAAVEMAPDGGRAHPALYVRHGGRLRTVELAPEPMHRYTKPARVAEIAAAVAG